jgi:hypothetical protein
MSDYKITIYTYGPQNPKDVGHAFIGLSSPGKAEVFVGFSPRPHVEDVKPDRTRRSCTRLDTGNLTLPLNSVSLN